MSSTGSGISESQRQAAEGVVLQAQRSGAPPRETQHPGKPERQTDCAIHGAVLPVCVCVCVPVRDRGRGHLRWRLVRPAQRPEPVAGGGRTATDPLHRRHPAGAQLHLEVGDVFGEEIQQKTNK